MTTPCRHEPELVAGEPVVFPITEAQEGRMDNSYEVQQLRGACLALSEALAKRCLEDANQERENPNDWPAGQSWDALIGSSHSTMRHRAWKAAGLSVDEMRSLLFDASGSPRPHADAAQQARAEAVRAADLKHWRENGQRWPAPPGNPPRPPGDEFA